MVEGQTKLGNTNYPKVAKNTTQKVLHPNAPWLDQPVSCWFCGKSFTNMPSLRGHLGHCRMRLLNRYFVVGKFLFTIQCNPLKKKVLSADAECKETRDPRVFLGLIKGYQRYGLINSYTVTELNGWDKNAPLFPDGLVSFNVLKKKMSSQDMQMFQTDVGKLKNKGTVNIQEESNTNTEVKK